IMDTTQRPPAIRASAPNFWTSLNFTSVRAGLEAKRAPRGRTKPYRLCSKVIAERCHWSESDRDSCGGMSELVKICTLALAYSRRVLPHGHSVYAAPQVIAA